VTCEHGQLARQCDYCEKDAEIDSLRTELAACKAERDTCLSLLDGRKKDAEEARASAARYREALDYIAAFDRIKNYPSAEYLAKTASEALEGGAK